MNPLIESFRAAVDRLEEALAAPETALSRDACIQRFEFCFELAWKAVQKVLRAEGLDCASPKSCLRAAWRRGWIEDEAIWVSMQAERNLTTHTYDEKLARRVYRQLASYVPALRDLLRHLSEAG